MPVPISPAFPDPIAENALYWACSRDSQTLSAFFTARHLPFEPTLLRKDDREVCHVFYTPTIRRFHADPLSARVSEIFFNVDTLALLTDREERIGDSLDVAQDLLSRVKRPLQVTLDVSVADHQPEYDRSLRFRFRRSIHDFHLHRVGSGGADPWAQDIMKSGHAGSAEKILVSRKAFEGVAGNAAALQPMVDSFAGAPFVRSKLSFEGGDLAFTRDPREGKLTMFYGTAAQVYWGSALTREEFGYVLRVEFGAAKAVYAGGATPHIDYSVKILPRGRIALVAEPVCGDLQVARAAAGVLTRAYADSKPPQLTRLADLLFSGGDPLRTRRDEIIQAANEASTAREQWKPRVSESTRREIEDYVRKECPGDPRGCLNGENVGALIEDHRAVLSDWVRVGTGVEVKEKLALRLLEVIRRQAAGCDETARASLDSRAQMLEGLGYRVIRVPLIEGDGAPASPWPGISYVNSVDIDDSLFVPEMGFGEVEEGWLDLLQSELRDQYHVVPVPAARLLLDNGGIHCAVSLVRVRDAGG